MAGSSELGPVELAPTTFGGRKLAFATQPCDRPDGARYAEDEQHSSKHFHAGQCK
jgi:hypothetical protein